MIDLIYGDSLEELKKMQENSIDSIVTDPPYGLSAVRNSGKTSKGGFMGKKWDYDVPQVELWRECLRVLKPGGHMLAFAGTRTQHRMAVNIEDAGFELRDVIAWVYGSGFPKSQNIGKAIDKYGGNSDLVNEISKQLKEARTQRGIGLTEADKMFCNSSTNYSWYEGRPKGNRIPDEETFRKIADMWSELKPLQLKVA